ncbi:MAG: hypothetical protein ACRDZ7_09890 [Acidimicrobiia bacterium]
MLDDGWVWHPVGMPRAWDIRRWLTANVWESEDGPSCAMFAHREYHWDSPMCWVNERLVAIWGLGTDDEAMLAGVTIFDVQEASELLAFAGPKGRLWSNGRRLYAAAEEGVTVWDPFTGQRTATLPGLKALAYNRWREEFVVRKGDELRRIRLG